MTKFKQKAFLEEYGIARDDILEIRIVKREQKAAKSEPAPAFLTDVQLNRLADTGAAGPLLREA